MHSTGTGQSRDVPPWTPEGDAVASLIHDLADAAAYNWRLTGRRRVALLVALYRELPSYAVLMYAGHAYHDLDPEVRALFWAAYRALLDDPDDRLADPIAYSLWCGYFEGPDQVDEAWAALTAEPGLGRRGTERLLAVTGPVPWALKAPLYERFVVDPSWHPHVLAGLVGSRFDYFGQIDPDAARRLLDRLRLPADAPGLAELRRALEQDAPTRRASVRRRRAGRP